MHCLLSRCAVAAGVGTPLRCDAPCVAAGTAAAMQATNWLLGKKPTSPSAASTAGSSSVKEAASPPDGQEASSDGASEAREPSAPAKRPQQSHAMQYLLVYLDALVCAAVGTCRDRRNSSLRLAALPTRRSCGGRHGAPDCNATPRAQSNDVCADVRSQPPGADAASADQAAAAHPPESDAPADGIGASETARPHAAGTTDAPPIPDRTEPAPTAARESDPRGSEPAQVSHPARSA